MKVTVKINGITFKVSVEPGVSNPILNATKKAVHFYKSHWMLKFFPNSKLVLI